MASAAVSVTRLGVDVNGFVNIRCAPSISALTARAWCSSAVRGKCGASLHKWSRLRYTTKVQMYTKYLSVTSLFPRGHNRSYG